MEIEAGQIWVNATSATRPDIEITRINKYSRIVYWHYVDNRAVFESPLDAFFKDHKPKSG